MNRVKLTGRLVEDPQLASLPDGTAVCKVRLAVAGMGREREVGFVAVSEFGAGGEASARTLTKGWLVAVDGRLRYRTWTDEGGANRHDYEVRGHIEFLAAPRQQNAGPEQLELELDDAL